MRPLLAVLLLSLSCTAPALTTQGQPLCQPEPKESPEREAAWDAAIAKLPELAKSLPKEPDRVLLMPVDGATVRGMADTYRAPRGGGRVHAGQDVFARRGTIVRSATDGIVWRIGDSDRGGRWVYVLGAGGRRYYYAHLASIADGLKEGQRVTTSTPLGTVGTTGNADSTPPHLHFGMYDRYDPNGPCRFPALDPLPLLRDRR